MDKSWYQTEKSGAKGGLLPSDVFVEANGEAFDKSSTLDDVALWLRGPKGSRVWVQQ
jgi:hypothetical protein